MAVDHGPCVGLLGWYLFLNVGITLQNKAILDWVRGPPHTSSSTMALYSPEQAGGPYLLTAFHSFISYVGVVMLDATLNTPPLPTIRSWRRRAIFISFSALYMVNIAMCNESMELVSLPLHQPTRATAPAITAAVSYVFRLGQRPHSYSPYVALIP